MNLMYSSTEVQSMPDAYERLVLEVLRGDCTNFVGEAELDASWAVFSPALAALEGVVPGRYAYGSPGPCVDRLYDVTERAHGVFAGELGR